MFLAPVSSNRPGPTSGTPRKSRVQDYGDQCQPSNQDDKTGDAGVARGGQERCRSLGVERGGVQWVLSREFILAAVVGFAKSMGMVDQEEGVKVVCICPG